MYLRSLAWGVALGAICTTTMVAAQDTKTVRVATSTTGMLYVPIYVAESMGYFAEEGLEVETQTMKSNAIMAAVIGGDVDIYPGTPSAGLRAASQGTDIRIFGALLTQYASNLVISGEKAEELGLTEASTLDERIAALKGMTIAVTGAGSGTHQLALYLLRRGGMNPDRDATIMFIGGSREILAAFENDRIDGFILSNPTSDTAVMNYDGFMLFDMVNGAVPELNGYPYITLDAREAWLKEDPERATGFVRAIGRAQAAIRDPATTNEVRDKVYEEHLTQFDKPLFDAAWANMAPGYPESPAVTEEMMAQAIEYLNEFSDEKYDPSLAQTALAAEYTDAIGTN